MAHYIDPEMAKEIIMHIDFFFYIKLMKFLIMMLDMHFCLIIIHYLYSIH